MDKHIRNKILIGVGAALVAAIGVTAAVFAPHIREVASVAKSAGMDEETVTAMSEENARLDQDLRSRFGIPDDNAADNDSITDDSAADNPDGNQPENLDSDSDSNSNPETPDTSDGAQEADSNSNANSNADENTNPPDSQPEQPPENSDSDSNSNSNPETPDTSDGAQEADSNSNANSNADENTNPPDSQPEQQPEPTRAPTPTPEPTREPEPTATPTLSPEEEKLGELVRQIYALRDTFNNRVDTIVNECISEFLSLDASEQTQLNKIRIVTSRLGEVANMEDECDNQVDSIVSQIRELDPALADQIHKQYQNEKGLKKASLMDQYGA